MIRRLILLITLLAVFAAGAFGWHVVFTMGVKQEFEKQNAESKAEDVETEMAIDVFTNVVTVTVTEPARNPESALEALGLIIAGEIVKATAPGVIERKINSAARENYDLYGMLVPYKVRMIRLTKKTGSKLIPW